MFFRIFQGFFTAVFLFLPLQFSFAYKKIEVTGLSRVSEDAFFSSIKLKKEDGITDEVLSAEVKNLYKTGFFSDIEAKYDEKTEVLHFNVTEVPIVLSIKFNGLNQFKRDDLVNELATKERAFYSKADVVADAKKLETIYKTLGVLDATVEPMIEPKEGGKVIVIFNIFEGKQRKVENIYFEGNKNFSDSTLKDVLRIKEKRFYRVFSGGSGFNIQQLAGELESLKQFYTESGFAKFEVTGHFVSLDEKNGSVSLYIYMNEGARYRFGEAAFKNGIANFDENDFKREKVVAFKSGERYNSKAVERTKLAMQNVLQKEGFVLSRVESRNVFLEGSDVVNVEFATSESRRIYVGKIAVFGNTKTNDDVVRREFLLSEGDVYDVEKLRRSVQRLRNTGYFKNVSVNERPSAGAPDKIDIVVNIEEGQTMVADFSVGYNIGDSFIGNVSLTESNLFGAGYASSISAEVASNQESFQLSFLDPYFLGRDLAFSNSVGYAKSENDTVNSYRSEIGFFETKGTYSITEYLRHSVVYGFRHDNLRLFEDEDEVSQNPILQEQEGSFTTSSIGHVLVWDKRDNAFLPNSGFMMRFAQNLAGLGGNIKYISNEFGFEKYHELFGIPNSVLAFKFKIAYIEGYGGADVNIKDRYSIGGTYGLRGFDYKGVGPKLELINETDPDSKYFAFGGKFMYYGTIEYRFPNFLPPELGFATFAFFDYGSAFGVEDSVKTTDESRLIDSRKLRTSAGVGFSWRSPIGVIGLSFAKPISKHELDDTRYLLLNIGGFNF